MFSTFVNGLNLSSAVAARQDCRKARKWGRSTRVHKDLGMLERALDARIERLRSTTLFIKAIEEIR